MGNGVGNSVVCNAVYNYAFLCVCVMMYAVMV